MLARLILEGAGYEAVVTPGILHHIFDARSFDLLRARGKVDTFCNYVATCHPLLQAPEGTEIDSFLLSCTQIGDPSVSSKQDTQYAE